MFFMDISQIATLSIVQGITEFLPISSSGHLALIPQITSWGDQGVLFDLGVHVGTLFAVMLYFRKEVARMFLGCVSLGKGKFECPHACLALMLMVSTLPLLLVAFLFKDYLHLVRSLEVIAFTSIFFGVVLYVVDKRVDQVERASGDVGYKQAIVYGLFQSLALVPGTSRSGICMTAGRLMGYSRTESSRYAMLMSIPVILVLAVYGLYEYQSNPVMAIGTPFEMFLGVVLSFVAALLSIHVLMRFVERIGFLPFVLYRLVLGVVLFVFFV